MYKNQSNNVEKVSVGQSFVLNGQSSEDVARAMIATGKQKEPFHIFDLVDAYQHIQHFKHVMPRVKIFYAVKANGHDMLLKLCISQGLGFDCASPGEIKKTLELGVHPRNIIFAVPSKHPDHMIYARNAGVIYTTFDSSTELQKMKQHWPDASLLIRIRIDSDCIYKLGEKFGCDPENEAMELLDEAANLGFKVVGVAFHVGSVCYSLESYATALKYAHTLFEREARLGRRMTIVDIGGGFLGETIYQIDQVAKLINSTIEELFPDPNIQIIAEPGRYLCDSSFKLFCNINNVRRVKRNDEFINLLYITDGVHGTLGRSEAWHTVKKFQCSPKEDQANDEVLELSRIFGPSCDYRDQVMSDFEVRLPRCKPLDWLVFTFQGSYTIDFASRFCFLEIPLIRTIVSNNLWNKLKTNPVFQPLDFVVNPDISSTLPSTLPPLPTETPEYLTNTSLLKI